MFKSMQYCFTYLKFSYYVISIILNVILSVNLATKHDNNKNLPFIIWWTNLLYPHEGSQSEIKCSFGKCISSRRKQYVNENIFAYLFYGTDFDSSDLPLPRKVNHVWALLHEESPMNNYIFSHVSGIKLFNYTSTFSRYSDYPLTTQFIPSLEYLMDRKAISIDEKNKFRNRGTAPIMYLQSHCNVASDRDRYVKKLMNFIDIDSYGACLRNKNLPSHLLSTETYNDEDLFSFISKYKFHIAYENALCDDYITEKIFRALHVGSVPIYKGASTIKDWVPSNKSVIIIDDFSSPMELAAFISKLDKNDDLYNEYLQFKETGITNEYLKQAVLRRTWGVNDEYKIDFIRGFECYLCDKLHILNNSALINIANKKHMNCPQPHVSIISEIETHDEWHKEDWIENYWFAFDQARAIELMIKKGESNSSNFMQYVLKYKYQH